MTTQLGLIFILCIFLLPLPTKADSPHRGDEWSVLPDGSKHEIVVEKKVTWENGDSYCDGNGLQQPIPDSIKAIILDSKLYDQELLALLNANDLCIKKGFQLAIPDSIETVFFNNKRWLVGVRCKGVVSPEKAEESKKPRVEFIKNVLTTLEEKHSFKKATVQSITQIIPGTFRVVLRPQAKFTFLPGQFVELIVPHTQAGGNDKSEWKSAYYSITSTPSQALVDQGGDGTIELVIKKTGAPNNKWLVSSSAEGNEVSIRTWGNSVADDKMLDPSYKVVFIAGGIGINPMISIMRYAFEKSEQFHPTLLWSARTQEDMWFRKVVDDYAQAGKMNEILTITGAKENSPDWEGRRGRIDQDLIDQQITNPEKTIVYICGPKEMMSEIHGIVRALGVPDSQIKLDRWF